MVCDFCLERTLSCTERKTLSATEIALLPESRTTAIAPVPGAVAVATIVVVSFCISQK